MSIKRASGGRSMTIPARAKGKNEDFLQTRDNYRANGMPRALTVDACDKCRCYIMVKKKVLGLRLRGWRFYCYNCSRDEFGHSNSNKELKIWSCQTSQKNKENLKKQQEHYEQKRLEKKFTAKKQTEDIKQRLIRKSEEEKEKTRLKQSEALLDIKNYKNSLE